MAPDEGRKRKRFTSDDFIKILIIFFIVLFWVAISGGIIIFLNQTVSEEDVAEYVKNQDKKEEVITYHIFTCEDVDFRLTKRNGEDDICYRPKTKTLELWITNYGEAEIVSYYTNVIGSEAMSYQDNNESIAASRSDFVSVPYSIDQNGIVEMVEVVPRIISENKLEDCLPQKIFYTDLILSCMN